MNSVSFLCLLLSSILSLVSASGYASDFWYTPKIVPLYETNYLRGFNVSISLTDQPASDVLLTMDASEKFRYDVCQLTFTASNWNKTQQITVYPVRKFFPLGYRWQTSTEMTSYIVGTGDETNTCRKSSEGVPMMSMLAEPKTCVYAENEAKSFDEIPAERATGVFTLLQSDDGKTVLQTQNVKEQGDSYANRVAVKHNDAFLLLEQGKKAIFVQGNNIKTIVFDVTPLGLKNLFQEYDITLSDGTLINVIFGKFPVAVTITAPGTLFNKVSGLCGNFNGDSNDEKQEQFFTQSAIVSLFECQEKCVFAPKDSTPFPSWDNKLRCGLKPSVCA